LQSRELLLVLDNCEHLLEATARLVDSLLDSCPQVLWPKGKLSVETGQTQRS
jgi:predicted ATPase